MTFSSQASLNEHIPCPGLNFALTKVKTEVADSDQEYEAAMQTSASIPSTSMVTVDMVKPAHIKTEVKSELPDKLDIQVNSNTAVENTVNNSIMQCKMVNSSASKNSLENKIFIPKTGRGRGRRGRIPHSLRKNTSQQSHRNISIAPKPVCLQFTPVSSVAGTTCQSRLPQNFPNILPKATSSSCQSSLQISSVFYTQDNNHRQGTVNLNKSSQNVVVSSYGSGSISTTCSAALATPITKTSSTTISGSGGLPALAAQSTGTVPYSPLVFVTPVLPNTSQNPFVLGASAPILIPVQNMNTLPASGLVSAPQPVNIPRSLANLQNLNLPQNQNIFVNGQPNMPKVSGSEKQSVGSVMVPPISTSQQISGKVSVLFGNQVVMIDQPSHFQSGTSVTNMPATINLPSLIQLPTSTTVTQSTVTDSLSLGQLSLGVSTISSHHQPVLSTVQSSTAQPLKLEKLPLQRVITDGTSAKKSSKDNKTQMSPPPLLPGSSASQSKPETASSGLSDTDETEKSRKSISESESASSSEGKLFKQEKTEDHAKQAALTPVILEAYSLKDDCRSSSDSDKKLETKEGKGLSFQCQEKLKVDVVASESKSVSSDVDSVSSVTYCLNQAPVISTSTTTNAIISANRTLLDASTVSLQNLLLPSAMTSMIQQPSVLLPQFQPNDSVLQSVINGTVMNTGAACGLYFPNTLSVSAPNIAVLSNAGQNVWIPNMADKQPSIVGSCDNQQSFLTIEPLPNNPTMGSVTVNPIISNPPLDISSPDLKTRKMSVTAESQCDKGKLKINGMISRREVRRKILPASNKEKDLIMKTFTSDSSKSHISESSRLLKIHRTVRDILQSKKAMKDSLKTKIVTKSLTDSTQTTTNTAEIRTNIVQKVICKQMKMKAEEIAKTSCGALSGPSSNAEAVTKNAKKRKHHRRVQKRPETKILQGSDKAISGQLSGDHVNLNAELYKQHQVSQSSGSCDNDILVNSDTTQSKNDVICKIADVKSISSFTSPSKPKLTKLLNGNHLFVGPLTKKQMFTIIKNPSELQKYVNVPSGHTVSSKALAVPAGGSKSCTLSLPQNPIVFMKSPVFPVIPFKPIQPKTEAQSSHPPLKSFAASTVSDSFTDFPQVGTDPCESAISVNNPQTILSTPCVTVNNSFGETKEGIIKNVKLESEKVCKEHSGASSSLSAGVRKKKFLSEKRRNELKQLKKEDSQNMMKLSFIGDLKLLKGALRKSTVSIRALDIDPQALMSATCQYDIKIKNSSVCSESGSSDEGEDEDRPKLKKWKWHNYEHQKSKRIEWQRKKVARTRKKRKEMDENNQKQWVPVEVTGDLTIRGKILEGELASGEESVREGKRRSSRISLKPKLDYAALEKLPFKELDEEIGESDSDFELSKEKFEIVTEFDDEMDADLSLLSKKAVDVSQPSPRHTPSKILISSAFDTTECLTTSTALTPVTSSSQPPLWLPPGSPSPPVLSPQRNAVPSTSLNSSSEIISVEVGDTEDTCPPVLTSHGIKEGDCSTPGTDFDDYYYSSESESDVFDSYAQSLSKSDKKKMMWKRHSEITMFLVKHAGKFHTIDDKGEHYCKICNKYKTNGIFSLSSHLKKHLSGDLRCAACSYEASHAQGLADHCKSSHLV